MFFPSSAVYEAAARNVACWLQPVGSSHGLLCIPCHHLWDELELRPCSLWKIWMWSDTANRFHRVCPHIVTYQRPRINNLSCDVWYLYQGVCHLSVFTLLCSCRRLERWRSDAVADGDGWRVTDNRYEKQTKNKMCSGRFWARLYQLSFIRVRGSQTDFNFTN